MPFLHKVSSKLLLDDPLVVLFRYECEDTLLDANNSGSPWLIRFKRQLPKIAPSPNCGDFNEPLLCLLVLVAKELRYLFIRHLYFPLEIQNTSNYLLSLLEWLKLCRSENCSINVIFTSFHARVSVQVLFTLGVSRQLRGRHLLLLGIPSHAVAHKFQ